MRDQLSGPVVRDTARLSQRYPPIARYGVFGVSPWPIGCDTPSPPLRACEVEVRYPPSKSDTCVIPYENKAAGCDTPLCDTISKGYCAIWGGISHWAAKGPTKISEDKIPTNELVLKATSVSLILDSGPLGSLGAKTALPH